MALQVLLVAWGVIDIKNGDDISVIFKISLCVIGFIANTMTLIGFFK
jgi:hypothetical protein